MRNMYANRVARGEGSTFLREKGRQSAMTASLGLRGAVITAASLATNRPSVSVSARVWRRTITFERRRKKQLVQFV